MPLHEVRFRNQWSGPPENELRKATLDPSEPQRVFVGKKIACAVSTSGTKRLSLYGFGIAFPLFR